MKDIIAIFTLTCFLISSVFNEALCVVKNPTGISGVPATLLISPSVGQITNGRIFKSDHIVITVQDLHCAPEVQRNISRILCSLDKKYRLKNVYVEGGYDAIDTSWLCNIKDKVTRNEILENLLNRGRLTGSEYYSVTSNRPDLLKGIDDEVAHKGNLVRLSEILDNRRYFEAHLHSMDRELLFMEEKYLASRSRKFNGLLRRYRAGRITAAKFYRNLYKYVAVVNDMPRRQKDLFVINTENYPNISSYLEQTEMSRHLQKGDMSRELRGFITSLKSTLSYKEFNDLLKGTDSFADIGKLLFCLSKLTRNERIDIYCRQTFPALHTYLDYLREKQECNPLRLVEEERELVGAIRFGLSRDTGELEVSFLADFYDHFRNYLYATISDDDYQFFFRNFEKFRTIWGKYAYDGDMSDLARYFDLLNRYYETNCRRNEYFLQNIAVNGTLLNGMATRAENVNEMSPEEISGKLKDARIVVIVTGGFHASGIARLLEEKNISYLTITPRVTEGASAAYECYTGLVKEQAKMFGTQAIALTIGSEKAKVVSISGDRAVLNINGEDVIVTLGRGKEGLRPFWQWRTPLPKNKPETETVAAIEAAANDIVALLAEMQFLSNPALGHEAMYRILKFLAPRASAKGIGSGHGLIWKVAADKRIQGLVTRKEKLSMLEFSQLSELVQEIIADHASAEDDRQAFIFRGKGIRELPVTEAFYVALLSAAGRMVRPYDTGRPFVDTQQLKNVLKEYIRDRIIERKQAHVQYVVHFMERFIEQKWEDLYLTFKPEDNVDKNEYVALMKELSGRYKKLSPQGQDVLKAATIFHDIGAMKGERDWTHNQTGAKEAAKIMKNMGYDEAFVERVAHVIYRHGFFPNIGIDFLPRDMEELSEEEKDILLFLNVFDLSSRANGNPLFPERIRWLLNLRDKPYSYFTGNDFYKYRLTSFLFPWLNGLNSREQRDKNTEGVENTLFASGNFGIEAKNYWNSMVRVYAPSLFYITGENSYDDFARLVLSVNAVIKDTIAENIEDIIIDTDIDLMALPLAESAVIVNNLNDYLKKGNGFPATVTKQGNVLTITVLLKEFLPADNGDTDANTNSQEKNSTIAENVGTEIRYSFRENKNRELPGHLTANGREAKFIGMGAMTQVFEHPMNPRWVIRVNMTAKRKAVMKEYTKFNALSANRLSPKAIEMITIDKEHVGLIVEKVEGREYVLSDTPLFLKFIDKLIENRLLMIDLRPSNMMITRGNPEVYAVDVLFIVRLPFNRRILRWIYAYQYVEMQTYNNIKEDWENSPFDKEMLRKYFHDDIGRMYKGKMMVAYMLLRGVYAVQLLSEDGVWIGGKKIITFVLTQISGIAVKITEKTGHLNTAWKSQRTNAAFSSDGVSPVVQKNTVHGSHSPIEGNNAEIQYSFRKNEILGLPGRLTVNGREAEPAGMGKMTQVFIHPLNPRWVIRVNVSGRLANMKDEFRLFNYLGMLEFSPKANTVIDIDAKYDGLVVERVDEVQKERTIEYAASDTALIVDLIDKLIANKLIMLDFQPANFLTGSISGNLRKAYAIDVSDFLKVPLSSNLLRMLYRYMYERRKHEWDVSGFDQALIEDYFRKNVENDMYAERIVMVSWLHKTLRTIMPFSKARSPSDYLGATKHLMLQMGYGVLIRSGEGGRTITEFIRKKMKSSGIPRQDQWTPVHVVAVIEPDGRNKGRGIHNILGIQLGITKRFFKMIMEEIVLLNFAFDRNSRAMRSGNTDMDRISPVLLDWHPVRADGFREAVHDFGAGTIDLSGNVHANIYVTTRIPENYGKANPQPIGITIDGKRVWADTERGVLLLFGEGLEEDRIMEFVAQTIVDRDDMPGAAKIQEQFNALLQRVGIGLISPVFRQGITVDHINDGRKTAYDKLGGMIVSAKVFGDAAGEIEPDIVPAKLGALTTEKNAENMAAARSLYLYLDELKNTRRTRKNPAFFDSIGNGQMIVDPAVFSTEDEAGKWIAEGRARKKDLKVYINLGSDDSRKSVYREQGFSGYVLRMGNETRIYNFTLGGPGIRAEVITGYADTEQLQARIVESGSTGKILKQSDVRRVIRKGSIIDHLLPFEMLTMAVSSFGNRAVPTREYVRDVGYAWDREELPALPSDIQSLVNAVHSPAGNVEEIKAIMGIGASHFVSDYLGKLELNMPQDADRSLLAELQKEFLTAIVEKMLAKAALSDAGKDTGLADEELEILLGRKLLEQERHSVPEDAAARAATISAEFLRLNSSKEPEVFFAQLKLRAQILGASDDPRDIPTVIRLILDHAEPGMSEQRPDQNLRFIPNSTRRILSAA